MQMQQLGLTTTHVTTGRRICGHAILKKKKRAMYVGNNQKEKDKARFEIQQKQTNKQASKNQRPIRAHGERQREWVGEEPSLLLFLLDTPPPKKKKKN